jgi:hypothetical protein
MNFIRPLWKTKFSVMLSVWATVVWYSVPHAIKSSWEHIKGKIK